MPKKIQLSYDLPDKRISVRSGKDDSSALQPKFLRMPQNSTQIPNQANLIRNSLERSNLPRLGQILVESNNTEGILTEASSLNNLIPTSNQSEPHMDTKRKEENSDS